MLKNFKIKTMAMTRRLSKDPEKFKKMVAAAFRNGSVDIILVRMPRAVNVFCECTRMHRLLSLLRDEGYKVPRCLKVVLADKYFLLSVQVNGSLSRIKEFIGQFGDNPCLPYMRKDF